MTQEPKTSGLLGSALLAAGLLCVFLGERVFEQELRIIASGAGGVLVVAAMALRVRAFSRAQGDVRGVEGAILAGYVGVLAALLLYASSTEPCLDALSTSDAARERLGGVLSVAWPVVLLVSASALFFMDLVYARMPLAAAVELRRVRAAARAGLTLALSVVFLASMSYVTTARDVRRDLSYFKTTEPSAGTQRMLQKLDTPLTVLLFFRATDDVLAQAEPYFATLQKRSAGKLSYRALDAALAPELARKHRISGNGSVLLLQGEGDAQKGQAFKLGADLIEARAQLKKLDATFQQSFAKLTRPERSALLTVGHAERNAKRDAIATGDGTRVMQDIFKRLNVKSTELGLAQGLGSAVPDGSSLVIIAGPRERFLPEETRTLLEYVKQGGRVLLMLDPNADDGLGDLLAGLGVERQSGVVASESNHMRRNHDASDRTLVFSNAYSSHPTVSTASRYRSEVASIFLNAVSLTKSAATVLPKPAVTFPLRTSPTFFRDLDGDFTRGDAEPQEALPLMAAVTLTEKAGAPEGRAVIIGDGDFMTDKVATNNGNMMVFVDALAWLIGNEELAAEVSSEDDVPLEHSRQEDKLWFYATTFAVPLPVLGVGVWVARRRRRRSEVA